LHDEGEFAPCIAIDALAKLNAKAQSRELWQFLKQSSNDRCKSFAVAALIQFDQRGAVPIAIDQLKTIEQDEQSKYTWEFIDKLKPKPLIPALISIYYTKTPFFADKYKEDRFRWDIYQTLVGYKTPLAIPVYRENLVDRTDPRFPTPSAFTAALLQELDAREAIDDITVLFNESAKGQPGSEQDSRAGELGIVLAKFGDRKSWKLLVDYVERSRSMYRGQIIAELNKQTDKPLWDKIHVQIPKQVPAAILKRVLEKLSLDTGVPVSLEMTPASEGVLCRIENSDETDGFPCGYVNGEDTLYIFLLRTIIGLDYAERGRSTFILDKGSIRIMTAEKAVEWWRRNMLKAN
jgi:hypothetical protein